MTERWRDMYVEGYMSEYIISNKGNIRFKDTKELVPYHYSDKGYVRVYLRKNRISNKLKHKAYLVHRLVLENFTNHGHMPNMTGDHLDKDKDNNCISNLMWKTREDNSKDSHKFGRVYPSGINANNRKYTEDQIMSVCELLELDELSMPQISEITKVKLDTVNKIKSKKQWTSISKDYNIPEVVPLTMTVYDEDFKQNISNIIKRNINFSNKEILKLIGIEYNPKNCMLVHRLRQKILEVSSTTRES